MADAGLSYVLIEGSGRYYGMFVIENIEVTRTLFFPDGKARRLEFSLKLARVDGGMEALGEKLVSEVLGS
ncbi:Phage P2 GpU [compost metagenome]